MLDITKSTLTEELVKEKLIRPDIAAKRLGISRDTIYRLINQGDLDAIRTSPRNIRIYESSIEEYLKKLNPDLC